MDLNQQRHFRVLVIEDDDDDWILTKKIFNQITDGEFTIERSSGYEDAIEQIERDVHDVYLVDYRLGAHTGTDILEQVHPEQRRQPFILLTGVADADLERRSLRLAAADYLVKGSFDATILSRTLSYAIERKAIEQQRIQQLVELNKAKEDFISIASHQLRTPATGVKQYLGMVIEGFAGEVSPEQMAMLEHAYDSNERQLRIISDLLKVAQVDSGKLNLRPTLVKVDRLVTEVIDELKGTFESRNQTIELTYNNEEVPEIAFDYDSIRMVLENIIDNASKYSPEGESIRVEITEQSDCLSIAVYDHGVGIAEADLPRLFEKFVRFDNSVSTKVGGTGLGLYWAKRIVDLHGGHIEYRPNHPQGSVFTVAMSKTLPKV